MRGLTSWHIVRRFLQLDHLLVGEMTAIVYQIEAVIVVAMCAHCGLGYVTSVDFHGRRERAHNTLEERLSHFRHDVRCSNNHTSDRDQLIYVFRIQETHAFGSGSIVGPYLNLMLQHRRRVSLEEHFICSHVESWYHFLWIAYQSIVKLFVECLEMSAVYIQVRFFECMYLFELLQVKWI